VRESKIEFLTFLLQFTIAAIVKKLILIDICNEVSLSRENFFAADILVTQI